MNSFSKKVHQRRNDLHGFTSSCYVDNEISNSGHAGYFIRAQVVSTESITQHLLILKHFLHVLELVAEASETLLPPDLTKSVRVKNFLLLAEARYSRYLELICSQTGPALGWPLPPWDVAMIFHAHMLSPFAFMADMRYRPKHEKLWTRGIIFPLQRLSELVKNGQNSDPKSEMEWLEAFPRDIYNYPSGKYNFENPVNLDKLEKVIFACPWCQKKNRYLPSDWISFRSDDMSLVCRCKWFRASTVSIKNIYNDYGSLPDRKRVTEHYRIIKGLNQLKTLSDEEISKTVKGLNQNHTWPDLNVLLKESPLDAGDVVIAVPFPHFGGKTGHMIATAYETPWQNFSLDLTAAALRQIPFSRKITKLISESSASIDECGEQGRARYLKFMSLIKENTGTFVPTLEVDLVWHTHQLFAAGYHFWCEDNVGRRVNHDDTIGREDLKKCLETTRLAWSLKYNDEYLLKHNNKKEPGILELRKTFENEKVRAEQELEDHDWEIEILLRELEDLVAAKDAATQDYHVRRNKVFAEYHSFINDYNSKKLPLLFHPRRFSALQKEKENRRLEYAEAYGRTDAEDPNLAEARKNADLQRQRIAERKIMREKASEENNKKITVLQEAIAAASCLTKASSCNSAARFLTSIHRPTSAEDSPVQKLQSEYPESRYLHGGSDGYARAPPRPLFGVSSGYGLPSSSLSYSEPGGHEPSTSNLLSSGQDAYGNGSGGSGGDPHLNRVIEYEALQKMRKEERRCADELARMRSRSPSPPVVVSSYRSSHSKSNTTASHTQSSGCGSCGSAPACGTTSYSSNTASNENNDTSNCGSNCGGGCGGD